jgi:hypothetical protein
VTLLHLPQAVVAIWFLAMVLIMTHRYGTGREKAPLTGFDYACSLFEAGVIVFMLHAGGFW